MILVALETSGLPSSIALFREGVLLEERLLPAQHQAHARMLVPELLRLLTDWQIVPDEITDVAVSVGPGSFTGLRVGVTCAKTVAFATEARLFAVDTFAAIAGRSEASGRVIVLGDAQRSGVFYGCYQRPLPTPTGGESAPVPRNLTLGQSDAAGQTDTAGQSATAGQTDTAGQSATAGQTDTAGQSATAGQTDTAGQSQTAWQRAGEIELLTLASVLPRLQAADTLTGDAVSRLESEAIAALGCKVLTGEITQPSATLIGQLALCGAATPADPATLEPTYIRKSGAEEKLASGEFASRAPHSEPNSEQR